MADYLFILVGLIGLTVVVNELLKRAAQAQHPGQFKCRVCGQWMEELPFRWHYQLPFEVWATVAKNNFRPESVKRYWCPGKHTMIWYLPKFGDRNCEVLVTKSLQK